MKLKIKEAEVQKSIKEWLEYNGWLVLKYNSVGIYKHKTKSYIPVGKRGVCDLLCFKKGWPCVGIECKASKGGVLSDSQKQFAEEFEYYGQRYILARSIDDVEAAFKAEFKKG